PGSLLKPSCRRGDLEVGDLFVVESGGQVSSKKRIALCAIHRLLNVSAVNAIGFRQRDQRSCEFHLWIRPAQTDRLSHKAISVQASRGIGLAFAHPLLVSLGQVTDVEPSQGIGATRVIRFRRASLKSRYQLLRYMWV